MPSLVSPDGLVYWLNKTPGTPKNARVARITQLLQAQRAVSKLPGAQTDAERQRFLKLMTSTSASRSKSASRSGFELEDLLGRYWVSPRVYFREGQPVMIYHTTNLNGEAKYRIEPDEIAAAMAVLQLALRDELDRIRKCSCGKFYLARRLDQLYCCTKCRVREHQSSEEFRAKRRVYLRNLYRLKKSGRVK